MPVVDLFRYPLDLTGISPNNFVSGEPHALVNRPLRAFVPNYGPFFSESLKVYDGQLGNLLTKNVHYVAAQLIEKATTRTGKEVCGIIVITDSNVSSDVFVDCQVIGGQYSLSVEMLSQLAEALDEDDRPVQWGQIIEKPLLFPPGHHFHDIGDVYGFEYLVFALDRLKQAILMGDSASHDEIFNAIQLTKDELLVLINNNLDAISNHVTDMNNPHATTKAQVGLGNVFNYDVATQVEAEEGVVNNKYMTPLRVKESIEFQIGNQFEDHVTNQSNPHNVTKTQVGLGNVNNFATATPAEAVEGVSESLYVTPASIQAYSEGNIIPIISTHAQNQSNPHNVTAAQTGAYTQAQVNTLLNDKLGKLETAVNSSKLENSSKAQVLAEAYAAVGTMGKRSLFVSTAEPTGAQGVVGDVWFKY